MPLILVLHLFYLLVLLLARFRSIDSCRVLRSIIVFLVLGIDGVVVVAVVIFNFVPSKIRCKEEVPFANNEFN